MLHMNLSQLGILASRAKTRAIHSLLMENDSTCKLLCQIPFRYASTQGETTGTIRFCHPVSSLFLLGFIVFVTTNRRWLCSLPVKDPSRLARKRWARTRGSHIRHCTQSLKAYSHTSIVPRPNIRELPIVVGTMTTRMCYTNKCLLAHEWYFYMTFRITDRLLGPLSEQDTCTGISHD